jgi:glycosyltransferase involved in cell wall biosynthesis
VTEPRVLLVTKGLDIGGLERVVVDLAAAMRRRGVDVEVALVNSRRDALAEALHRHSIPVHELGGTDRIGWAATRRLAVLVRADRYDVVHAHGPLPAVVVRLASRRTPVVTTSHTMWGALRPPTRLAWWATAGRDAATLAVSSVVARSLPGRPAERAEIVPHGVDPRALPSPSQLEHGDPAPSRTGVTAVTVASHRHAKDYPTLLRALRIAIDAGADLRIVAVGEGPDLPAHEALAATLGLTEAVDFRPPTPDVLHVIASGDLLVVASGVEGQPLVVVEALALGRPVVATAVGRVPELVTPSVGRVVPPGDPTALAAALVEVANDPDLRRAMQKAAAAAPTWTIDDVVDAHLAIYRRLADTR